MLYLAPRNFGEFGIGTLGTRRHLIVRIQRYVRSAISATVLSASGLFAGFKNFCFHINLHFVFDFIVSLFLMIITDIFVKIIRPHRL